MSSDKQKPRSSTLPKWLEPFEKNNAYTPTKAQIENLEPQSREEVLLKYLCLGGVTPPTPTDGKLLTPEGDYVLTNTGGYILVNN